METLEGSQLTQIVATKKPDTAVSGLAFAKAK